jgi:hypothetical protein
VKRRTEDDGKAHHGEIDTKKTAAILLRGVGLQECLQTHVAGGARWPDQNDGNMSNWYRCHAVHHQSDDAPQ